jgi:hypothetical protein
MKKTTLSYCVHETVPLSNNFTHRTVSTCRKSSCHENIPATVTDIGRKDYEFSKERTALTETRGTHVEQERCIYGFGRETWWGETIWKAYV